MTIATYVAVGAERRGRRRGLAASRRRLCVCRIGPRRTPERGAGRRRGRPASIQPGASADLRRDRALRHDARWRPRSSGRGCSRCSSAARPTRSRSSSPVFLVGIGIGSALGSALARNLRAPGGSRWAGARRCVCARDGVGRRTCCRHVAAVLADRPVDLRPARGSTSSSTSCARLWAVLPGAAPLGRELPARAGGGRPPRGQDPGRLVGRVYAANTSARSSARSAPASSLIAWVGTQHTQQLHDRGGRALGAADACPVLGGTAAEHGAAAGSRPSR